MNDNNIETIEPSGSRLNFFQRVFGVIFSPKKVMEDLAQKPRILFALLLNLIYPALMIYAVYPMYIEFTRNLMETVYTNFTPEQIEQSMGMVKYTSAFGGVGVVVIWFITALVLWGATKIFKGEGRYKQVLSVTGYAAVITLISTIFYVIMVRITGTYSSTSYTSLATILPDMKGTFLYGALKSLDLFSIWQYIVIAIGLQAVTKLSKKKVYIIVAVIFVLLMLYSGGMEMRTGALM